METKFNDQNLFEWVELLEPTSQKVIYANLESGEIRWDSPANVRVRPLASEQWWELFDVNTQRHYYHNVRTGKTEWHRPPTGDVIPLSNLQLIKQFANAESRIDKDIGVMHRHKLNSSTSSTRNSIHMTPQDHRKMSAPGAAAPPVVSRHGASVTPGPSTRPISHRRRNSQPSRSASNAGTPAISGSGASLQQRSTSAAGTTVDNALVVTANQRVTEWLRSAGSVPEEAEEEPIHFLHKKPYPPSGSNQGPHTRWSTTRGVSGISYSAFQPQPPPHTSTASRHTLSMHHNFPPSCNITIKTTPYDRRVVSMVPPPPLPPLHAAVASTASSNGQESAFTNLLYDMSCNVVPSQPTHQITLASELSGLSLTPRSVPRTNPHAAGTMPRLPSSMAITKSELPPPPKVPAKMRNGGVIGGNVISGINAVTSSSPDTEITTNSPSASASYSGDSEPEENDPFAKEVLTSTSDASIYSKEDIFEQHPFRPAAVTPVDEYTFTMPRHQSAHLQQQQQQVYFQPWQCLADPSPFSDSNGNNWVGYQHLNPQLQPNDDPTEQAPPTPPPRLASAMNTMQLTKVSKNLPVDNMIWQNFETDESSSGFLARNHPFRQPLKQASSYPNPALSSVSCIVDDTSEDLGLTHTSTRSLLSASSSAHENSVTATAAVSTPITTATTGSTHSASVASGAPLHPRRSASGGFIGPADAEIASLSSSSAAGTASTAGVGARATGSDVVPSSGISITCSGSTHFALISGSFTWPKNLLRQGHDSNTLMSWTKAAFSKRLLAATDKSLHKHIPENFKLIQSFMGDRNAKLSKPDLASIIVQRALTTPGVRDELYAQLCKQTTGNYNADSLMRGWELICICLYFFPPNKVFRDPLHAYLTTRSEALSIALNPSPPTSVNESSCVSNAASFRPGPSLAAAAALAAGSDPAGLISAPVTPAFGVPLATDGMLETEASEANSSSINASNIADIVVNSGVPVSEFPYGPWVKLSALHFTRAAPRWFMRSVAVGAARNSSVPPSKEELLHVKDFLLKPGIFGSSLEEMMKIQSCRFPSLRLPWIQIFLTEELLRLNGAKAEGIFRVSADQDVLTSVRFQLERLFEVFRVLEVASRDPTPTFTIVRPPPRGWSNSQQSFSPDPPPSSNTSTRNPILLCPALTGPFCLPLKPSPIPSRPSEYMLLTPRALWPGDLAGFGENVIGISSGVSGGSGGSGSGSFLDPHLAAALLKLWLREMATPLVPPSLTTEVFAAAVEAEAFEKSIGGGGGGSGLSELEPIEKCCVMVRRLPKINRRVLLYLIKLCQHLARPENASVSLMDARNLATVIAPNLFRSASNNPSELLNSVQSQTAFTRLLICHLDVDSESALLNSEGSTGVIGEYCVVEGSENGY